MQSRFRIVEYQYARAQQRLSLWWDWGFHMPPHPLIFFRITENQLTLCYLLKKPAV
jgi:hypothetical protein